MIIKIDFNVTSDRTYGFMLDDDLFEFKITWLEGIANYHLVHVDSGKVVKADQDLKNNHLIKAVFFIIIIVIIAVVLGNVIGRD